MATDRRIIFESDAVLMKCWKVFAVVTGPDVMPWRANHAPTMPCSNTAAKMALLIAPVADTMTGTKPFAVQLLKKD
jgi:hypothetical protein